MVYFVGAGPGDPELITVKGKRLMENADIVIYAGSLVNPALLASCKSGVKIFNSAKMTLDEVIRVMEDGEREGLITVRLHTGDPSVYGAVREQMDMLDARGISYESVPGVSSFCGAAAALNMEYTLPGISQTVILTRLAGRTGVPDRESVRSLAAHRATMVLFLSAGMLEKLSGELIAGGYSPETPAAIVYKATWPDEKKVITTVENLAAAGEKAGIAKTALVIVGEAVGQLAEDLPYDKSRLYAPDFETEFRKRSKNPESDR